MLFVEKDFRFVCILVLLLELDFVIVIVIVVMMFFMKFGKLKIGDYVVLRWC